MKTITITGHRPQRIRGQEKEIRNWIREQLQADEYDIAYSGMASGTDQIFAEVTLECGVPLVCWYPFPLKEYHPNQERINMQAVEVKFTASERSEGVYTKRDREMIDASDVVLAVFDGIKEGGTWRAIEYAENIGKQVVYYPFKKEGD